ncbi:MAG: DUF1800 family protein [Verrucomicrobiota bacterium]|nr:DUF1800 family protein [Verrucomicrobiota bacterium]
MIMHALSPRTAVLASLAIVSALSTIQPAAAQVGGYTLSASPATVAPGGALTVSWAAPAGRPSTDWVGLYQVGAPNDAYLWWTYTDGTTSGSAATSAPGSNGQYEFRYLLDNGYEQSASSNAVTVGGGGGGYTLTASPATVAPGGALTVSWTAPAGRPSTDWIGLYQAGTPSDAYLWWTYTDGTASGSATTSAPGSNGQYEFRYFLDNSYEQTASSSAVTVGGGGGGGGNGLEVGSFSTAQPGPGTWHPVAFQQPHTSPIVVFGPVFQGNAEPAMVRVRNVTSTGFEYQISEWEYQDGVHPAARVSYLVSEEGSHTIAGLRWQAGRVAGVTHLPSTAGFAAAFAAPPVVLAQVATINGPASVVERLSNVTTGGFTVQLDEEEAADGTHAAEEVHFIAIEAGSGRLETNTFVLEVGRSLNNVTDSFRRLDFSRTLADPFVLADVQTRNGSDPVVPRYRNLLVDSAEVRVQEETSADPETAHGNEVMGYIVVAGALDSDEDGLPNDYEIANGMDPNNPADAGLDYDGDGITNLNERRFGTNPRVFDSGGTITIEPLIANGFEQEATSARFRVNRTGGTVPVTVNFTLGGAATPPGQTGADYRTENASGGMISGAITVGFNSTSAVVVIEPVSDTTSEYPEDVTLTISPSSRYEIGAPAAASVTLADAADTPANEKLFVAFLGPQGGASTTASGVGTMYLNGPNTRARVSLSFSGLTSGQTNAYLRYGVTSGVGPELRPTFPNGQLFDEIWDVVPVGIYSGQDIVEALFQVAGKFTYVNVGTAQYPAGEISGIWTRQVGSGTFVPPPDPPPIDPLAGDALTRDVGRFLTQATFGPTQGEIDALVAEINNNYGGDRLAAFNAWIDQQFALEHTRLHDYTYYADQDEWARRNSNPVNFANNNHPSYFNRRRGWWTISARAYDQLRQRVAFAMSQIFVISEFEPEIQTRHYGAANYYDQLGSFADGNYRDLLKTISQSPIMGYYLSHLKNQKAVINPQTGQVIISPDENYAREVMQLFSIGLVHRHPDGSLILGSDGLPISTYTNDDITELARVFTGWSFSKAAGTQAAGYPIIENNNFNAGNGPRYFQWAWLYPMKNFPNFHDTGAKTVLGSTIPAGLNGDADMDAALDILFYHPNVGQFISKLLIQRLVTSNPSNGYVYRVALKFQDNGGGVRGDLKAVIRAILLDYEARSLDLTDNVGYGKQKEPIIRYLQFIRAVDGASQLPLAELANSGYPSDQLDNFPEGTTLYRYNGTEAPLGQIPLRAPTVFNWFPPDYNPGGVIASAGLVAPELRLTNESSVIQAINYHYNLAQVDLGQDVGALVGATNQSLDNVRLNRAPLVQLYDAEIAAGRTVTQAVTTVLNRIDALMLAGNLRVRYESAAAPNPRSIIIQGVSAMTGVTSLVRVKELLYLVVTSPEYINQK